MTLLQGQEKNLGAPQAEASVLRRVSARSIMLCLGIGFVVGFGLFFALRGAQMNYLLFGSDLYPRYLGARALWAGQSPYASEVQRDAELLIYGRARQSGEVTYLFQYPAHLGVVLAPLLLVPLDWVGVIWCALLTAILLTFVFVWSWQLTPRPPPLVWGLVLLSGIFFFPAVAGILAGQYPLLILAFGFGALWLIARGQDGAAGVLLACATVKPSIGLFFPAVMLVWALRWKRYRLVLGLGIGLAVLLGISFARAGWWIPDFLNQSQVYEAINERIDLAWSAREIFTLPGVLWLGTALALCGIGFFELWMRATLPWLALFGAMSLNMLAMPHSLEYDLTMFLLVLFWLGWQWRAERWGMGFWLLLVWTPWLLWGSLRYLGFAVPDVWRALWQIYPPLLNAMVLGWWFFNRNARGADDANARLIADGTHT